jgi:hypothetical protein
LAFAPSSLILANNFLPLNEALCCKHEQGIYMKILQILIGVPLTLFGLAIVTGTLLNTINGTSNYSSTESLIIIILLGILPSLGGLYLSRLSTKKDLAEDKR